MCAESPKQMPGHWLAAQAGPPRRLVPGTGTLGMRSPRDCTSRRQGAPSESLASLASSFSAPGAQPSTASSAGSLARGHAAGGRGASPEKAISAPQVREVEHRLECCQRVERGDGGPVYPSRSHQQGCLRGSLLARYCLGASCAACERYGFGRVEWRCAREGRLACTPPPHASHLLAPWGQCSERARRAAVR